MEYPLFETSCNFQSILINILLVLIVDVGMNAMSTELIPTTMNKNLMYVFIAIIIYMEQKLNNNIFRQNLFMMKICDINL